MTEGDDADLKWGERKVEVEDSVRTVECLRGRLLAERLASRNAKAAAEKWDNKLIELESMLKEETISRNKAEKKLRFLMKKLESLNRSQLPDESQHSASPDKTDVSSQSSYGLPSSFPPSAEEPKEVKGNVKDSESFHQNGPTGSNHNAHATTESSISEAEAFEPENNQKNGIGNINREEGPDHYTDSLGNSLAIVSVNMPPKENPKKIDPEVLDSTVNEVLDTLKRAKESLQSSMLRRRGMNMIKV